MNANGTGQLNRTNNPAGDTNPAWSPDGQQIAFTSNRDGNDEIYVMNADGTGQLNRTNNPAGDIQPAWSPDGQQIAFESNRDGNEEIYVMNADGTGQLNRTNNPASDENPDWQPLPKKPVIFVHGFLGSKIVCDGQELWPNLPLPRLMQMELERDGRTNRFCASAGPVAGQLLETALGSDIYKSTVDFLRDLNPNDFHLYAYDWRKNPEEAVAGLDALVDQVRPEGGQVVLMAHSMGGLVVRSYVEDAGRATKVSRAVTVGTPYWGSPKALFPFIYGVESPGLSALDAIFDNDELRAFARHLQGMFFLWPSAQLRGLAVVRGPRRAVAERAARLRGGPPRQPLAARHSARGPRRAARRAAHQRCRLSDGGRLGDPHDRRGVDRAGLPPRGHPGGKLQSHVLARVRARRLDEWRRHGPAEARPARPRPRCASTSSAACRTSRFPGQSSVTARLRGFLLDGDPIASLPVSGVLCDPSGFALSIFPLTGGLFPSSATARPAQAGAITLDQAEAFGVLEALNTGSQIEAATSYAGPMTLSLPRKGMALRIANLKNGKRSGSKVYGPIKKGKITVALGGKVTVRRNGKRVKPRRDDKRDPKTRVKVKAQG